MYLLYMDESGDPGFGNNNNFVLAGVAVHEGQVFQLGKKLDDIQSQFFPTWNVPIGFHATEIRGGKNQPFKQLSPSNRTLLMSKIYDCVSASGFPQLVAFATVMDASTAQNPHRVLHDTFQDVLQRFNIFLTRLFGMDLANKGLAIIDQAHQPRYRELFADFKRIGTQFQGPLTNVIDIPYFAGRRDTRMLQLADFCAYAVFRKYESGDTSYFQKVLPKFDRPGPHEPPHGLKHFTRLNCSCEACVWR